MPVFSPRTREGRWSRGSVIWLGMEMSLGLTGYEDFDPQEELPNLNAVG